MQQFTVTDELRDRAQAHAALVGRLARLVDNFEFEAMSLDLYADPQVGDIAHVTKRGKDYLGEITQIRNGKATVTYLTRAGINQARRDWGFHQGVTHPDYPVSVAGKATPDEADNVFAEAVIKQVTHRTHTSMPYLAWTPLNTATVPVDRLKIGVR